MKTFTKVLLIAVTITAAACTKYKHQKTPWPVGYSPLYFHDITMPYNGPLKVVSYQWGDGEGYDNAFFYTVAIAGTDSIVGTRVVDYQLATKPYHKAWWKFILNGKLDSLPAPRDTFTVVKPGTLGNAD